MFSSTWQEVMPLHQISNGSSSAETTADSDEKPLIEVEVSPCMCIALYIIKFCVVVITV